jgi:phosphoribosylformylglycinamidine (FGAM) synthase-like amidotransferase family enzyme
MNRTKSVKKDTRTKKSKKSVKKQPLRNIKKTNKSNKKATSKLKMSRVKNATEAATTVSEQVRKNKVVRIMGEGQFVVDNETLNRLNKIDNSLVQLVSNDRSDNNTEFKKRLLELVGIVEQNGKRLDPKRIIPSDIILPSVDLSIDEAKKAV